MAYDPSDLKLPGWFLGPLERIIRIRLPVIPGWWIGLTRLGAVFLFLTVGVIGAALYSGNNLLYLCGAMLLAFGFTAIASAYHTLSGAPQFAPSMPASITAGSSFNLRQNLDWRPDLGAMIDVCWDDGEARSCFDIRCTSEGSRMIGQIHRASRGIRIFERQIIGTEAPIGLWRVERSRNEEWQLAVLPEPITWSADGAGFGSSGEVDKGEGDVFSDLRAYVPGDMPTRIHWKKAIDDNWSVKRFMSSGPQTDHCLCVDLRAEPGPEFERLLGCAYGWMLSHPTSRLVLGQEAFELGEPGIWLAAVLALAGARPESIPPIESSGLVLSVWHEQVRRAA